MKLWAARLAYLVARPLSTFGEAPDTIPRPSRARVEARRTLQVEVLVLRQSVKTIEDEAKKTLGILDAKLSLLPTPPQATPKSPGAILLAGIKAGNWTAQPFFAVRAVRREAAAALKACRRKLVELKAANSWLLTAADFIEHGGSLSPPPSAIPFQIEHAVRAARSFVKAGTLNGPSLASPVRAAAIDGSEFIDHAVRSFGRFPAAAQIIIDKKCVPYFEAHGERAVAAHFKRKTELRQKAYRERKTTKWR